MRVMKIKDPLGKGYSVTFENNMVCIKRSMLANVTIQLNLY